MRNLVVEVGGVLGPGDGHGRWHVTVQWSTSDPPLIDGHPGSGVAELSPPVTVTQEGHRQCLELDFEERIGMRSARTSSRLPGDAVGLTRLTVPVILKPAVGLSARIRSALRGRRTLPIASGPTRRRAVTWLGSYRSSPLRSGYFRFLWTLFASAVPTNARAATATFTDTIRCSARHATSRRFRLATGRPLEADGRRVRKGMPPRVAARPHSVRSTRICRILPYPPLFGMAVCSTSGCNQIITGPAVGLRTPVSNVRYRASFAWGGCN